MYLSKLELHGFKSFAERTTVQFADGVTAIVGPNGCGKSNIVDAVRWVIGEQRARILRSEKMENVIFNGTSRRRALGMAEVMLTVENTRGVLPTEYSEVTLGRRLYRSGDSEYLLNGVKCRLQDIVDLFMDTGMGAGAYSVIELKMVDEILSDNAQDRRRLFEEAAGITKYKLRRRQALGKLDGTQADLTRLRDLTDEIEKRVASLKRQAAKAARFQRAEERLHLLERALAQVEYDRLTGQRQALRAEIEAFQAQLTTLTADEDAAEARLAETRAQIEAREATFEKERAARAEQIGEVRRLEADLRLEEERTVTARRALERARDERDEATRRQGEMQRAAEQLAEDLADAEPVVAEREAVLAEASAARDQTRSEAVARRQAAEAERQHEREAEEARAQAQRQLDRLASRLDLLEREQHEREAERVGLADDADERARRHAVAEARRDAARAEAERQAEALARTEEEAEQQQRALDEARRALHAAERRRDALAAEHGLLESLVASYEDFSDAVQFLAETAPAPLTTVADVLGCDEAHRTALAAALGEAGGFLVTGDLEGARAAMQRLRTHERGRATFVLLDRLPAALPAAGLASGVARPLADVVRVAAPAYERLARMLLHDAYLVPTLDEAAEIAAAFDGSVRFFTPDGEWADARGLVHGGAERAPEAVRAGRMARREQRDAVHAELEAAEAVLHEARTEVARREATLAAVPLRADRDALRQAEREQAEAERAFGQAEVAHQSAQRRQADLDARLERIAAEIAESGSALEALRTAAAEAEAALTDRRDARTAAEEAFQTAELESRIALGAHNEAHVAAVQARNQRDNLLRDLDRTRRQIADLERQAASRLSEIETLQVQLDESSARQAGLERQAVEARASLPALEAAVVQAEATLQEARHAATGIEAELRALRQARDSRVREENQRAVRLAEVETRLSDLIETIRADFEIDLGQDAVEIPGDFEEQAARAEVRELRGRLKKIGVVNALALESYEEEKERLDFLTAQRDDLEHAEQTLLDTIREINTTAAERFDETYTAIRESFARLFHELFGGDAKADLQLVDPDDPLESAIEIFAQPRGKRPSTIAQLSGGEKTLTAIALLFAIYLVKPSPFCILDEVDAPLDDANVDRFMHLIREFADDTQFILVTHNKRTMELADRLYGVTMQEQGVSQLVGVKFDEALELREEPA